MSCRRNVKYGIAQKYNLIDQVQTVWLPHARKGHLVGLLFLMLIAKQSHSTSAETEAEDLELTPVTRLVSGGAVCHLKLGLLDTNFPFLCSLFIHLLIFHKILSFHNIACFY